MSHNPNSTRKRPRADEEDQNLHQHCPPRKKHEKVSAHDHARQHNGDQYHVSVNISYGGGNVSRSPEPTAIETALESLIFPGMGERYYTIDALLAPSSCRWLLDREEYKSWQDIGSISEHHGFLWIKGKAGTGKSTLMKFAFEHASKTRHEDQTIVSFFFNARGMPGERSLIGMYQALLYQILDKIPRLQHLLCKRRTLSAETQEWSPGILRSLFQDVIENLASEHLICYVDALDECTEDDAEEVVLFFENLGELSVSNGTKFHVCFASRHYPHITIERSESIVLEDQDGHKADISSYIKKKLKISNTALKEEMSKEIEHRASGVFLWVTLVVGILNDECSCGNAQVIRSRLESISTKMTNLIQGILDRDKPTKYLVPLLQWVLFSRRPLTPEELFLALQSIEPESIQDSHTLVALTRDNISKFILNTSKGLVETTKGRKPKVQFIHELVRTHFLGPQGLVKLQPRLKKHFKGRNHDQLKKCCFNYLMSYPRNSVALPRVLRKAESIIGKKHRSQILEALPFLQYALENVLYHANLAHADGVVQDSFITRFPLDTWRKLDNVVARYTSHRHTASVSQAYILAEQGCAALLDIAMRSHPLQYEPRERCRSVLGAAVEARDLQTVKAVLKDSGYEDSLGKTDSICMTLAIESGELEIVKALVSGNVIPYKYTVDPGRLHAAPKNNAILLATSQPEKFDSDLGRFGLLRLILGMSSEGGETSRANALEFALQEACKAGDTEAFKMLYAEFSPTAASRCMLYQADCMLCQASRSGSQPLVRLLLRAMIEHRTGFTRGFTYLEALLAASEAGHGHIARYFLRKGANGATALVKASAMGHATSVRLLLDNEVDVEAIDFVDDIPRNALEAACQNGHLAIARILIERNARINGSGKTPTTPLYLACKRGHEEIAYMLLENGANINPQDGVGITPLSRAIIQGHPNIARLLIENGADIRQPCHAGKSALYLAADRGDMATAELLISNGANVNNDHKSGDTALSAARLRNHTDIADLLIQNGAV